MVCEGIIRLRRATVDDAANIASVHHASWCEACEGIVPQEVLDSLSHERRETFWRTTLSLASGDHRPWVAENDAGVVGFVSSGMSRDDDAATTTGEVYAIHVAPECWSRGIGRELLGHAERDLRTHGFQVATLWVSEDDERARTFYERFGWHLEGARREKPIGHVVLREVRYRFELI